MTNDDKAQDWCSHELPCARYESLSAENERLQFLCDLNAVPAGIIEDRGRMEERAAIVAWLRDGFVRDWDQLTITV